MCSCPHDFSCQSPYYASVSCLAVTGFGLSPPPVVPDEYITVYFSYCFLCNSSDSIWHKPHTLTLWWGSHLPARPATLRGFLCGVDSKHCKAAAAIICPRLWNHVYVHSGSLPGFTSFHSSVHCSLWSFKCLSRICLLHIFFLLSSLKLSNS